MGRTFRDLSGRSDWGETGGRWHRQVGDTTYHVIELLPRVRDLPREGFLVYADMADNLLVDEILLTRDWERRGTRSPRLVSRSRGLLVASGRHAIQEMLLDAAMSVHGRQNPATLFREQAHTHFAVRKQLVKISLTHAAP